MSKTLYVGLYDYPYSYQAYEFINNEFVKIDISRKNMENDIGAIHYYDCYDCEDNKIRWYDKLSNEVKQYDNIIVCEDGYYNLIDLTKLKNEGIKATSLHLDNFDEDTSLAKFEESLITHIQKAQRLTLKKNIKANEVIIDEDLAIINKFGCIGIDGSMHQSKPMICGLKVAYEKDLAKDFGYNFILTETTEPQEPKTLQDYTDEELLEELLRRKEQ